jgi:hypothetical protein
MILPSDKDYKRAKKLKKSSKKPPSPFCELAEWISDKYEVQVINIEYDKAIPDDRPRLNVILNYKAEELKFCNSHLGSYKSIEQKRIHEQFDIILKETGHNRLKTDGLFVVFSAFESVARIEANDNIPEKKISRLKDQLKNKDLWIIRKAFDSVTFFFFTDDQVREYEKKGFRQEYAKNYLSLLKPYDEFNYFTIDNLPVYFDSKENFDTNYNSNWYYYFK